MFADEGAVVVASSYTKVGGVYDNGFRHDPDRPLESLAEYCMECYTNLNLPSRVDMLERYVNDYQADGFLVNSVKSCNSFSSGQLMILREIENRTGRPGGFVESDLVDPRYFSASNIKNRLESYFQMIDQKRSARRCLVKVHRLEYTVGIDLGSTTTKAVVLDPESRILRSWHHQQPQQLRRRLPSLARRGADQRAFLLDRGRGSRTRACSRTMCTPCSRCSASSSASSSRPVAARVSAQRARRRAGGARDHGPDGA